MPVAHGAFNRVHSSPVSGIPQRGFLVHHATIGIVVDGSPDYEPHAAGSANRVAGGSGRGNLSNEDRHAASEKAAPAARKVAASITRHWPATVLFAKRP
jgi:hypothetical protein